MIKISGLNYFRRSGGHSCIKEEVSKSRLAITFVNRRMVQFSFLGKGILSSYRKKYAFVATKSQKGEKCVVTMNFITSF